MQIYLVGGAVRDSLLGLPVEERDWVVVGATVDEMFNKGFRAVGKDFPVFLHPETHDEYALARTERKTGKGYKGFSFHTSPTVTLEEDLYRRDITINAMAMDPDSGKIIDPCNGQKDIALKLIRHTSPAFREDPLRVLRVARFAARFFHLGFRIAEETSEMMKEMVASGELAHLVPERVWKELEKTLPEKTPEIFISTLRDCDALQVVLPEIDALFGIPQPEKHHPEIDTGLHTLMALQQACRLSDSKPVRFATLVHDLGKASTPKNELPRHIAHEHRSIKIIKALCQRIAAPNEYRDLALSVARYHTHCHRALVLKATTLLEMLTAIGAFRDSQKLTAFLLCCQADAQGRTGFENTPYPQAEYISKAFEACKSVNTQELLDQGYSGEKLGMQIRRLRVGLINNIRQQYR